MWWSNSPLQNSSPNQLKGQWQMHLHRGCSGLIRGGSRKEGEKKRGGKIKSLGEKREEKKDPATHSPAKTPSQGERLPLPSDIIPMYSCKQHFFDQLQQKSEGERASEPAVIKCCWQMAASLGFSGGGGGETPGSIYLFIYLNSVKI